MSTEQGEPRRTNRSPNPTVRTVWGHRRKSIIPLTGPDTELRTTRTGIGQTRTSSLTEGTRGQTDVVSSARRCTKVKEIRVNVPPQTPEKMYPPVTPVPLPTTSVGRTSTVSVQRSSPRSHVSQYGGDSTPEGGKL